MKPERVTLNPVTEDSSLAPLDVVGLDPSWGIYLMAHDYPPPKPELVRTGSIDTEGERVVAVKWGNRTIPIKLRLFEPADPAAVNLVPNPSFELGVTGWEFSSGSFTEPTRTQEPAPEALVGNGTDYAMRLRAVKDNTATERFATAQTLSGVNGIPVVAGTTYTQAWYLYVADEPVKGAANNFVPEINWYDAGGVLLSTSAGPSARVKTGESKRMVHTAVAPANAAFCRLKLVGVTTTALDVVDFYVDRVMLTATAEATPYFDGDTPGCDWSGARHGSTSSRPAPDGTRFARIYRDVFESLDRMKRERSGTYRRIAPGFNPTVYDIRSLEIMEAPQEDISHAMKRAEVGLAFEALPGGRGPEIQIGGNFDELAKPAVSLLAENVPGDMPALGRLQLEDRQGQLQLAAWWGLQQQNYSAAASAELFYEAESRTPVGLAALAANGSASGAGNNVVRHTKLVNAWQAVLSTQAAGAGAHLSHVGSYRVLARVSHPPINSGEVSIRLAWTQGDFVNVTENDPVTFGVDERETDFSIEDLGIVTLDKAPAGTTQRWEGRVLAKSTTNSGWVDVDWLLLIPIDEGSGEVRAASTPPPAVSMVAFDAYEQAAGALTGKAAALGGVYVVHEGSDTDDFQVSAIEKLISRTAVSDTGELMPGISGRAVGLPVNLATVAMSYDFKTSNLNTFVQAFQFLRYKDKNNFVWVRSGTNEAGTQTWVDFNIRVAGESTYATGTAYLGGGNRTEWQRLTTVLYGELFFVYLGPSSGTQTLLLSGVTSKLAALAAGGAYIGDRCGNATATTRWFDNLRVWEPTIDAAIYPNRMLEVRDNLVRRQDKEGVTWGEAPYEGDYLLVPQAGPEKRVSRIIAKASRNPEVDTGIDDIRAKLFVVPRYLIAPPT